MLTILVYELVLISKNGLFQLTDGMLPYLVVAYLFKTIREAKAC